MRVRVGMLLALLCMSGRVRAVGIEHVLREVGSSMIGIVQGVAGGVISADFLVGGSGSLAHLHGGGFHTLHDATPLLRVLLPTSCGGIRRRGGHVRTQALAAAAICAAPVHGIVR